MQPQLYLSKGQSSSNWLIRNFRRINVLTLEPHSPPHIGRSYSGVAADCKASLHAPRLGGGRSEGGLREVWGRLKRKLVEARHASGLPIHGSLGATRHQWTRHTITLIAWWRRQIATTRRLLRVGAASHERCGLHCYRVWRRSVQRVSVVTGRPPDKGRIIGTASAAAGHCHPGGPGGVDLG